MRAYGVFTLLFCLALSACEKSVPQRSSAPDTCATAKGTTGHETDAQAVQACRANKKFSGPDVKRSHIQITNH
jgi:hypothetical protein